MAFSPNHDLIEELKWRGLLHDAMPGTQELLNREMVGFFLFSPLLKEAHAR